VASHTTILLLLLCCCLVHLVLVVVAAVTVWLSAQPLLLYARTSTPSQTLPPPLPRAMTMIH
jgi:hypothetical protein